MIHSDITLWLTLISVLPFLYVVAPRTWIPGELVTAGMMNGLRDLFLEIEAGTAELSKATFDGKTTAELASMLSAAGQAALAYNSDLGKLQVSLDGAAYASLGNSITQTFRNLTLRTHPNADVAAHQVWLDHADGIVMNDGEWVPDWNDLTADIAVSGENGLDTGSEAASTHYQILAIRKSSDGTKGLLLHRAKDYFLDESLTGGTDESGIRLSTGTRTALAQTFDTDTTGLVEKVAVRLNRIGTVSGRMRAEIRATSAGAPTGAALATSDKMDASLVSTTTQWIEFIFRSPVSLTAGTTYALVLTGDWTPSDTNTINWRRQTGGYAAGAMYNLDGGVWASTSVDTDFKIYVTRNDSAPTLPSGYDQYGLIGWVYNDSGSDFDPMVAKDHYVGTQLNIALSGSTATIPTLADLSSMVPPVPCIPHLQINSSANTVLVVVFGVPDGYGHAYNRAIGQSAGNWSQDLPGIMTDFQGLYAYRADGTGGFDLRIVGFTW